MSDNLNSGNVVAIGIVSVVGIGLLTWSGIYVTGFFNAEREAQRTNVVQESFAYQRGMQDELNDLFLQYNTAEPSGQIGIRAVVRDRFGTVDTTEYPAHLQTFLSQLGER